MKALLLAFIAATVTCGVASADAPANNNPQVAPQDQNADDAQAPQMQLLANSQPQNPNLPQDQNAEEDQNHAKPKVSLCGSCPSKTPEAPKNGQKNAEQPAQEETPAMMC